LIVATRVALLAVAVLAVVVGASAVVRSPASPRADHLCPMHPDVRGGADADCPICGMRLERAGHRPAETVHLGTPSSWSFADEARAPAWVADDGTIVAAAAREDLAGLPPDTAARFFAARAPHEGRDVRLIETGQPSPKPTATARFAFAGRSAEPRRGDIGWVVLPPRPRDALVVPLSAVVETADGPCVFVASDHGGGFVRRHVELGRPRNGARAVLSGLRPDERIAVSDAFFLEAEQRLIGTVSP
jgi:Heavy metal binding domain